MTKDERRKRNVAIVFGYMHKDTIETLAERHGIHKATINNILIKEGAKDKKDVRTTRKWVEIMLKQGGEDRATMIKQIANEAGITVTHTRRIASELGLTWTPKERDCKMCGAAFVPSSYTSLCCSPQCRKKATMLRNKKYAKKLTHAKICENCKKTFRMKYGDGGARYRQRFCTLKCYGQFEAKKHELRNSEILYLRKIQDLTFIRIGEIFDLNPGHVRRIYIRQKFALDLGMPGWEMGREYDEFLGVAR